MRNVHAVTILIRWRLVVYANNWISFVSASRHSEGHSPRIIHIHSANKERNTHSHWTHKVLGGYKDGETPLGTDSGESNSRRNWLEELPNSLSTQDLDWSDGKWKRNPVDLVRDVSLHQTDNQRQRQDRKTRPSTAKTRRDLIVLPADRHHRPTGSRSSPRNTWAPRRWRWLELKALRATVLTTRWKRATMNRFVVVLVEIVGAFQYLIIVGGQLIGVGAIFDITN